MQEVEARLRMLMLAGLAGDTAAYRQLLTSSGDRLRQYFGRRLGAHAAEVEDLVQETLLAIHQKRDSYNRALPFTSWLHAIARYKLIDHYRRNGKSAVVPLEDLPDLVASEGIDPALAAYDIEELFGRIPEKHRAAIQLTKIEGYSVAEASAISGQSESAIKIGVHRGMKKLMARVRGSGTK